METCENETQQAGDDMDEFDEEEIDIGFQGDDLNERIASMYAVHALALRSEHGHIENPDALYPFQDNFRYSTQVEDHNVDLAHETGRENGHSR